MNSAAGSVMGYILGTRNTDWTRWCGKEAEKRKKANKSGGEHRLRHRVSRNEVGRGFEAEEDLLNLK